MNPADFWKRVRRTSACWEWSGARDGFGYGMVKVDGVQYRAHRMAWILTCGDIPSGQMVLHSCDNPACANPGHLRLGTQSDNMRDKVLRDRQAKGFANGSHTKPDRRPKGERVGGAKLKDADVVGIKKSLSIGATLNGLARKYGVTKQAISFIKRGLTWRHVNA